MNVRVVRLVLVVFLPIAFLIATTTSAFTAGPVILDLQGVSQANLGDNLQLTATLRDSSGAPIRGATIDLWSTSSFLSTGGAVQLGQATTDGQGVALFAYQPRDNGTLTVNASFAGDALHAAAQGSLQINVQGSAQLYDSTAGIKVPGISKWILVGVLSGVWSTYVGVMVLLTLIAREGSKTPAGVGGPRG